MKITLKIVFDLFTTENANSYLVIFQEFLYDIQWETFGNFPFNFTAVLDQFPTNLKTKMSQKSLEDLNMCAVPEPSWCSKSTRTLFKAGECAKSYLLNRQGQGARHWASCSKYAYMYTSGLTQVETKVWKKYWRLIFWKNLSYCWAFFFSKSMGIFWVR